MEELGKNGCFKTSDQYCKTRLYDFSRCLKNQNEGGLEECDFQFGGGTLDGSRGRSITGDRCCGGFREFGTDARQSKIAKQGAFSSKEGSKEIPLGDKSETFKCFSSGSSCKVRGPECSLDANSERMVDVQIGSKGRLFSCESPSEVPSIHGLPLEREMVSLQCSSIWPETLSNCVYMGGQRNGKKLEKSGSCGDSLFGRLPVCSSYKGRMSESSKSDKTVVGGSRMAGGGFKVHLDSMSEAGVLRSNSRHESRSSGSSIRKDFKDYKEVGAVDSSRKDFREKASFCGRSSNQSGSGFCSGLSLHQEFLPSIKGISREAIRLGGGISIIKPESQRCFMDNGKSSSFQEHSGLEANNLETVGNRFILNRMGLSIGGDSGRGSLGYYSPHQLLGTVGSSQEFDFCSASGQRVQSSFADRQYSGSGLFKKRGRNFSGVDRSGQTNLELVNRLGGGFGRLRVDSRKVKQDSRLSKSMDRSFRLDSGSSDFSRSKQKVGSFYNRQDGIGLKFTSNKVQFNSILSRNRGNKLFHSGLDKGQQLGGSSFWSGTLDSESVSGAKSKGCYGDSKMGGAAMVASAVKNSSGISQSSIGSLSSRPVRDSGTIGRSQLDSVGLQIGREANWELLNDRVQFIRSQALSSATWKSYAKWWKEFVNFCGAFELGKLPEITSVLNFIGFLEISGKGYAVVPAVAAIGRKCREMGWKDVSKEFEVKETVKGVAKLLALGRLDKDLRQPLPVSAIRTYLENRGSRPYKVWIRDAAMLVLGFRGMRRASELLNLKRRDLLFRDGMFILRIRMSKTDKSGSGRELTIEASNDSVSCPVKILEEFLRSDYWEEGDFLFRSGIHNDKKLSVSLLSNLVKRVAREAGLKGRFSSHSLCIGGATAGMMGGMSMEQIRAVGHWESDAVLLYLRSVGASLAGASRRMGL